MKNNSNIYETSNVRISEKRVNQHKPSIIHIIAGTAATIAIIGSGIFGIGYLNSHSIEWTPLKEGASNNTGGSQPGVYTSVSSVLGAEKIDISELKGKIFKFSDRTISIDDAYYDGQFIRVDYTQEITNTENSGGFILEPISFYRLKDSTGLHIRTSEPEHDKAAFIMEVSLSEMASCSFVPAIIRLDDTERIPDLVITVVRDHAEFVMQPVWDDIDNTVADGMEIRQFWASGNVLEADFDFDLRDQQADLDVYAVANDGKTYPLTGKCINSYSLGTDENVEKVRLKYYFISADPNIPSLAQMRGFTVNGKFFEINEKSDFFKLTTNEYSESVIIENTTDVTTAVSAAQPEEITDIENDLMTE